MDCSTFQSKITGEINCDAIRKTGAYGPSWLDVFSECRVIVYSESDDLKSGYTILIKTLDKTNPPEVNQIEFRKDDKQVSTVSDSFANQALAQLPYKSSTPSTSGICDWISVKGGKTNIKMFDVLDIIGAYKGTTNIGFTPKTFDVVGVLAYYKGEVSDGDAFITC